MKWYPVTVIVGAILWLCFMTVRVRGASLRGVILKAGVSVFFLLTLLASAACAQAAPAFWGLLGGGALLGLLGDIWLDLRYAYPQDSDAWTKAGFCSFALGHFFYIAAVILGVGFSGRILCIALAGGIAAAALVLFGEKPMGLRYGAFRGISVTYGFVLFFTALFTLLTAVSLRDAGALVMGVGLVLFAGSDLILSRTYFAPDCCTSAYVISNHALYYAGQYLIALSPLWLGRLF